ncbi:Hsp20 family protein [Haliea sp. AH-315-K21]|uniref:Heat-shock protein n=1 Tax=SAR86 cluster bacterium TaxID=2030880 RepID=A0A2A5CEP6_9GAMM|nr:Hsp20 family protein [Haliea sp. AH-315-K21]MBN4075180.1 Hsp20 family protein [Gammaproteobacteria bacterium AH-315-E17]PCJ42252.1 MAG: heat-shock protein [SAR86 cluster bacterium]
MTTFDFSPLYRSTIGFDHLANLLDNVTASERSQPAYPPYNIELLETDKYRISMAVAGFEESEISVETEDNALTISARKKAKESEVNYLHQGIAERNFKRQFKLEDHVQVVSATLKNGLLHVDLVREIPEAMKPRRIAINEQPKTDFLKSA